MEPFARDKVYMRSLTSNVTPSMIIKVIRCIGLRKVKRTEIYRVAAAFRNDFKNQIYGLRLFLFRQGGIGLL